MFEKPTSKTWITIAFIALFAALSLLQTADEVGAAHVDNAFKRALIAFAIARGLNGVISVAQGTEIAVQPAGVGVNFTPGQILDPVNDLVERFSWIMMLASSSLGIQKILLSMSAWHGLLLTVLGCALLLMLTYLVRPLAPWQQIAKRVFLFFILLRFMMPVISIANDWTYRTFLENDYQQASASLEEARQNIGQINARVLPSETQTSNGIFDRARKAYQQALAQINIDKRLEEYRVAAEAISENTIRLVVVFIMQTLVFPIIFLFIVFGLVRRVTASRSGSR